MIDLITAKKKYFWVSVLNFIFLLLCYFSCVADAASASQRKEKKREKLHNSNRDFFFSYGLLGFNELERPPHRYRSMAMQKRVCVFLVGLYPL